MGTLDARYSQLNMKYNLGDLQRDLGAFKLLGEKKDNGVIGIIEARDKIETSFWQRPNFGWTLECESKPETSRAAYLKVLARITTTSARDVNLQENGAIALALIMSVMALVCAILCGLLVTYILYEGFVAVVNWSVLACGMVWPLGVIVSSANGQGQTLTKANIMAELEAFKGCGDA